MSVLQGVHDSSLAPDIFGKRQVEVILTGHFRIIKLCMMGGGKMSGQCQFLIMSTGVKAFA